MRSESDRVMRNDEMTSFATSIIMRGYAEIAPPKTNLGYKATKEIMTAVRTIIHK
jgi:hypothetical protein